jgi:hypothetical protein
MNSKVLHADEAPHRMLEGDEKSNWCLWGFPTNSASYFEPHDTRSGSVAADIIKESLCGSIWCVLCLVGITKR